MDVMERAIEGSKIVKRYNRLKDKRATWESVWQEIADYIIPNRATITVKRSPGAKTTTYLYDSTAVNSCELLAANLHGTMTNPATKWFSLKMRDEALNEIDEVQEWLEACADAMMRAMNQSNFNSEVQESFLDLVAFGTGCLYEEEKPARKGGAFGGLNFRAFSVGQFCIEEDAEGRVKELCYEVEMSAGAVYARWGDACSEKTKETAELKPETPMMVLHCVYPRSKDEEDGDPNWQFESYAVELSNKHLLSEGGFHEFPFHVPRWRKCSGEIYGRGPGHTGLPDTRTLNRAKELGLKAWAKVIDPPLQAEDDGVIQNVSLTPGSINTVSKVGGIAPIESGAKFDVHFFNIKELKTDVRAVFFSDQLILREGPQMTAEEVRTRYELMQRLIGPTIGRLESELLNSLIERTFGIMLRAGALPELPDALQEFLSKGQGDIDVEYEGPLAKAQRSHEANSIAEVYTFATGIAGFDPSAMDVLDNDAAIREFAEIRGCPYKVIRDEVAVKKLRGARSQQMAADAALQRGNLAADTQTKLATAGKAVAETPGGSMSPSPPMQQ